MTIHDEFSGTLTLTENSSRELFRVLQEQDEAFISDVLDGKCGFTLKSADGRSVELVPKADRKTEPTISKMEQVEDEPQTEDGIMPEVKAEVRFDENNKTLWIKTDTVENYDRVIIEDGSNWCRIFYEECGECAHNTPRSNDEPQTDCAWR